MTPQVMVMYTNTLFAEGVMRLLTGRTDCSVCGVLPVGRITAADLVENPATLIILEGDESDPVMDRAMRLLAGRGTAFTLVRVNIGTPTLRVYRFDQPVPAGLDELTGVIRRLTEQPSLLTMESRLLETPR